MHVAQQNFVENAIKIEAGTKAIIAKGPTAMEYSFGNAETDDIEFAEMSTATNNDDDGALIEAIEFPTDEMFDVKEESEDPDNTSPIKVENIDIDEDIEGLHWLNICFMST